MKDATQDILARLRAGANGFSLKNERGDYGVCDTAADEIERLRRSPTPERDAVIEECASRVDAYKTGLIPEFQTVADWIADALRSLKSPPRE
jgi:RNA polymerase-binding transcription factor DksA